MAAFFHDTGKILIPTSILNKKNDFSPMEQELIKRHPIDGIKLILRSFGLNEISILSMLISYEHHMKLDCSGYPSVTKKRDINLFSRIVSIANDFDSLISKMYHDHGRYRQYEALKLMYAGSGSSYDPYLLDTFAGIFQQ
jgi:HD-GYP domain-containing protein (c-di-GMP phosphodiesterase class II)